MIKEYREMLTDIVRLLNRIDQQMEEGQIVALPNLTHAEAEARALIKTTYAKYGRGLLSCWGKDQGVYIDGDAAGNYSAIRDVRFLIDHARNAHTSPHSIVFTSEVIVMDTL